MEENERTPLFTNTYGPSETFFRQSYLQVRRFWRLAIYIIAGGFLAYACYQMLQWFAWSAYTGESIFRETSFWMILAEIALMTFLIVWESTAPKRYADRQMRRVKETYGANDPRVHIAFYDDEVAFHNDVTNSSHSMRYASFAKCAETKDLILIITREKQLIGFPKNAFTGVDVPGFRAFMDEKCPNAKRRWRKDA